MLLKYNVKLFFFINKVLQNQRKGISNIEYFKQIALSINRKMGVEIRLIGEIPESQNFIMYSNHRGLYDPIIFYTLLKDKDFSFVIKDVLQNRFMDKVIETTNSKYFSQNPKQDSKKVAEILEEGINVVIFPEGCRNHTEQLQDFRVGAFKIAMKGGKDILPIVITNTENVWDDGCRGSKKVLVKFLMPITPEEYKNRSSKEIANKLKLEMQEAYIELKSMQKGS